MNLRQREPLIFERSAPGKVGLDPLKLRVFVVHATMIGMQSRSLP